MRTSADGRRGSLGPAPFCANPRSVPAPRPPRKKRSAGQVRKGVRVEALRSAWLK